jgi:PAS domain S-box-containing protein
MKLTGEVAVSEPVVWESRDFFNEHQQAIFKHTDRMFAILMVLQWVGGVLAALWISPKTWTGPYSQTHIHVWAAIFLGGAISALPISLALTRPGRTSTRYVIAIAQMLMSGLLIHLTGGRIETHFHVFGSLAFLSFYRDWRVLVPATLVVAADHLLRGIFWPQSVFGVLAVSQWRWLEHAGWVLFEDTFLYIAIKRSVREMWDSAERTAEIKNLNENLEIRVAERTALLESSNEVLKEEVRERELAEKEIGRQRSFLRQVIDLNPSFIFAKDREGRFTLVNQSIADAYGTTVDDLLGKTDGDFNANSKEVEQFRKSDLEVIEMQREKFIPEEVITDSTGCSRWLQTIKRPLTSADGIVNQVLGVATDITRHKELEEQLRQSQKMEAVGVLAGGIAHDFNNSLTAINGYCDLTLRRLEENNPVRKNLEEIKKAGIRATSLTRQLLAFSRKQIMQAKVIDLNSVVAEMDNMLRRVIGEDIDLVTLLQPDLGKIKADPGQIEQVLMNLVVNARDAMPTGGKMTIETRHVYLDEGYAAAHVAVQPGHYVMLAISDNGTGMNAETAKRIFDPFFTTKGVGKGTGLGLSTVYGIIKQSGGNVWVYSEPGYGTTFKTYLPSVDQDAGPPSVGSGCKTMLGGTETILLVEDEPQIRRMAFEFLSECGYKMLVASNGVEAVQVLGRQKNRVHLIVTDVVMPQMSGRELAERVAAIKPEIKVLYMSGYTNDEIVRHGVLESETWFIQKPFAPDALASKIREVLSANESSKGKVLVPGTAA